MAQVPEYKSLFLCFKKTPMGSVLEPFKECGLQRDDEKKNLTAVFLYALRHQTGS